MNLGLLVLQRMDEPDLSFIESDISLDEVKPIEPKRLIAFINCFLTRTVRFLNDFAGNAEGRILQMEIQLERIETALTLLEARLASIPALASVSSTSQIPVSSASAAGIQSGIVTNDVTVTPEITRTEPLPVATKTEVPIVPLVNGLVINDSAPVVLRIRDDPEYAKYFKMLKMGVIMPAVKQKMAGEGLDPNLLDTPDAPSPNSSVNCDSTGVTVEKPIASPAIPVPAVRTSVVDQKAVNGPSVGKDHGRTEEEDDGGDSDSAASSFSSDG